MVTLFTVKKAGITPIILTIAALLGRTVIVLLQSTVLICLPLVCNCIISLRNGLRSLSPFYVTNLLANV